MRACVSWVRSRVTCLLMWCGAIESRLEGCLGWEGDDVDAFQIILLLFPQLLLCWGCVRILQRCSQMRYLYTGTSGDRYNSYWEPLRLIRPSVLMPGRKKARWVQLETVCSVDHSLQLVTGTRSSLRAQRRCLVGWRCNCLGPLGDRITWGCARAVGRSYKGV